MPAHLRERLFEPFFTTAVGRGLGLSITCSIIASWRALGLQPSCQRCAYVLLYVPTKP